MKNEKPIKQTAKKKKRKKKEKETNDITKPKGQKKTRMIHDEEIKRNYEWRT